MPEWLIGENDLKMRRAERRETVESADCRRGIVERPEERIKKRKIGRF